MQSKKRVRDGADVTRRLARIQEAAVRFCQKVCLICHDKICEVVGKNALAVEITCGCQEDVWHDDCLRQHTNATIQYQKNGVGTILCPGARHEITVQAANPSQGHRVIQIAPAAEIVMRLDKENGGELIEVRKKARAEIKQAQDTAVQEAERKASEDMFSVQGMKNFLAAFYGRLLPDVLRKFPVDMYSLCWYPAIRGDSVGMGHYGDRDIEPWRSPDGVPHTVPHTVPSTQVQLRVKFKKGKPANWEDFRAALRLNLGCQCSTAWKYKAATFHVVHVVQPVTLVSVTKFNYRVCERQIHDVDTWVLTLELCDPINRCKKSGASDPADVQKQIADIHEGPVPSGQCNWPARQNGENSLGEPTDEVDGEATSYVVYRDCGERVLDVHHEDYTGHWWGCENQLDDFQEVKENVEALESARRKSDGGGVFDIFQNFENFQKQYINVTGFALSLLCRYLKPHIQTYLSSTPFQEIGIRVVVSVVVGYDEVYRGTILKLPENISDILYQAHLALISALEKGNWWAKIKVTHLQGELQKEHGYRLQHARLAEDATEWDNCVQGFQNKLHDQQELFGVSYRDLGGHEVVVKTTVDGPPATRVVDGPPDVILSEDGALEILLFWWNMSMTGLLVPMNQEISSLSRRLDFRRVKILLGG
jgi:hypothetical protein